MRRQARYLGPEAIKELQPPRWLLDGFLIEGGLTVLFGAPKTGKSMLALDMALCISTHQAWYNRETRVGTVLYVAGEGVAGIGNRILAWEVEHGRHEGDRLIFRDTIVDLIGTGGPEGMLRELVDHNIMPNLIVIDTLAKSMVGGDENGAEDMGRAIDGADRLRHVTGSAVLLLHHTTKSNDRMMRGSGALLGAADVVLGLTKQKDGATTLSVDAARDFESGERFDLRMMRSGSSAILVPAIGYESDQLTDEQVHALIALAGCTEAGISATRAQWKDASSLNEASFVRMLASLTDYIDRTIISRVAHFDVNIAGYERLTLAVNEPPMSLYDEWKDPWEGYDHIEEEDHD